MTETLDVKKQVDTVFSIANTLRGTYAADKYRDVIIPMIIIRRLECALEDTKDAVCTAFEEDPDTPTKILMKLSGYAFYNTSRWSLAKLLAEPQHIPTNLRTYLDAFSPNIKEILSDLEFDKQIKKMAEGAKLTGVVRKFSELDLHPERVNNVAMGYMFEEIIRRFSENADAGDHYTPREIVHLLTNIALAEGCEDLQEPGKVVKVGDFACGTGGMLSSAQETLTELCPQADVYLYGQEVMPETHAICLADMLIKGQDAKNIRRADTMKEDCFPGEFMRIVTMNPPFGLAWGGKDAGAGVERAVKEEYSKVGSRFPAGLPAKGDMQLLFMQHVVSKLDPERGRACVISNGSPLFSGGTSSSESQIRRWLLENDLIEAIIALPTDMFYNTGIGTYIWVLSMDKRPARRGFVQLIDASDVWTPMRKSLGNKRRQLTEEQVAQVVDEYKRFEESEITRILPNEEFLYKEYAVYQPLQRSYQITEERIEKLAEGKFRDDFHNPAKLGELSLKDEADMTSKERKLYEGLLAAEPIFEQMLELLLDNVMDEKTYDWTAFEKNVKDLLAGLPDYKEGETTAQRNDVAKKVAAAMSEMDKDAPLRYKRDGSVELDPATKDTEIVKLAEDVDEYMQREVLPYVPDAQWFDEETEKAVKTGAEIPFTRYFYQFEEPEPSEKLLAEFMELEAQLEEQIKGLVG